MEIKELQEKRNKLFYDYYHNVIPERMPVQLSLSGVIAGQSKGVDINELQYDYSRMEEAVSDIGDQVYSDICPIGVVGAATRIPGTYQLMHSQTFRMAENGQMQHPEVVGMYEEDYESLIKDPYACILETIIPRQQKAFGECDPISRAIRVNLVKAEAQRQASKSAAIVGKLKQKYGYYSGAPAGSSSGTVAPFDFLGDQLRSFSGICTDVRRHREQVSDACKALLPLLFSIGMPGRPDPEGAVSMFLHMPTYLRRKDFEELWLPSYLELIQQFAARGSRTKPFLEENWMKYIDILQDFPAGTVLTFEQGDPKIIKDTLGKKFLISGLYPLMLLKTGTKEQVIDKAKEILDIMLPGGGYILGFDKTPLQLADVNLENFAVLTEYLRDNAKYGNEGEHFGTKINAEGYEINPDINKFDSKYKFDWADYKERYPSAPDFVKKHIEADELNEMRFYLNLLI